MSNKKVVLLVEDSDRDAELITMATDGLGIPIHIQRAHNGNEAFEMLHSSMPTSPKPSLILLDIKLPRLNGKEVLSKIKNDPFIRHIPVVMLTSSQDQKDLEECYKLGANAYVVKPIDFNELFETLAIVAKFWCAVNKTTEDY